MTTVDTALTASYDPEADTLYVYLSDAIDAGDVTSTVPVAHPGVLLEVDAAGRLVGLEVLQATRTLPPSLLTRLRLPTHERHD